MAQQIMPIYEPLFSDGSFGYRPGRSAKDAIRKIKEYVEQGYTRAVVLDLSNYFDTIGHVKLLNLLRQNIKDERVIQLIKRYLKSGVMENGVVTPTEEGSPQGGSLSPLLANIYLNEFDQEFSKRGVPCIRYADDIVLLGKSERASLRLLESSVKYLEETLKLKVNRGKSRAVSVFATRNFKYLGFCFGKGKKGVFIRVHQKSKKKFKDKLRRLTSRSRCGSIVNTMKREECERCVLDALKAGYRSIDTAQSYFNEGEVGNAIEKAGIPREDIFLTSKIWVEHYGYDACKRSVEESLKKLKIDYLDLMLLHQPFSDYYGSWRALEDLYEEGVLRAIGVSNFYPDRLVDIASFSRIAPMIDQVETHPYNQQSEAKKWMEKYEIQHEAWAPFGEGRNGLFEEPVFTEIGRKYGKTPTQVILRWHIQRNTVVIPKSTHHERMIQNINFFDFVLSDEDMQRIASLDKQQSSFFSHYDPNMVEWFVKMVEERKTRHKSEEEKKEW